MKGIVTLCEVGVLLSKEDAEYEAYNHVWNRKFGFFNENDILYEEKDTQSAINYAKEYVKNGVDRTYAIIGNEGECVWEEPFDDGNLDIIAGSFDMADVLYSIAKINNEIVEDFLNKDISLS